MRIGLDSRPLREPQTSGIPMFVRSLLRALSAIDKSNEYILYAHKEIETNGLGPNFRARTGAKTRYGSVWMQAELPFWMEQDKLDVFWGTQHILPVAMPRRIRAVLTMHDLVHYVVPKTMKPLNFLLNKLVIPPSVKRADAVVADTHWTLQDVKKYLQPQGKIMEVVYLGIGRQFYPRPREEARLKVRTQFGVENPYFLTVGTFEPRKNITALIRAFSLLADKIPHDLVIVGQRGWKNKNTLRDIQENEGLKKRIRMLGYVSDDSLPDIYSAADLFIFPSLYEGFGLPPLEAMACGTPVVCSNVSSIPEIVGEAACLVNPQNPEDIARGIQRVIEDDGYRDQLVNRGRNQAGRFRWEEAARLMIRIFNQVAKN